MHGWIPCDGSQLATGGPGGPGAHAATTSEAGALAARGVLPSVRDRLVVDGQALVRAWQRGVPGRAHVPEPRRALQVAAVMTDVRVSEAVALVAGQLATQTDLAEPATLRLLKEIGRFASLLGTLGVERLGSVRREHAEQFLYQPVRAGGGEWADPSVATLYLRRTSVRLLFRVARQLQLVDGDPTLDIELPPRSGRVTRALSDDEEALGRIWAKAPRGDTRHPCAWALGQASGTTSELAVATVADLDLAARRVRLHGHRDREPRWGQLTDWGVIQVKARLADIDTAAYTPLISVTSSRSSGQVMASRALVQVLQAAGLSTEPGVKPSSLAAWAGAQAFEQTGRIDLAARTIGVGSLDLAADIIGWDW